MAILSDIWIREAARTQGMIEPFVEAQRRDGCIKVTLQRVEKLHKTFTTMALRPG